MILVLMHLQVRGAYRRRSLESRWYSATSVLMHLQVRGASRLTAAAVVTANLVVLMHLQVRGASRR